MPKHIEPAKREIDRELRELRALVRNHPAMRGEGSGGLRRRVRTPLGGSNPERVESAED